MWLLIEYFRGGKKNMKLKLIENSDEVKRNIIQYNRELKEGRMHLSTNGVQQWYYIEEIDLFGPSRYIGYQDVTIEKHSRSSWLSGGETTNEINKQGFMLCEEGDLKDRLTDHLINQLSIYNRDVRRDSKSRLPKFKLNILKSELKIIKNRFLQHIDI